jgi:hypothetical protein
MRLHNALFALAFLSISAAASTTPPPFRDYNVLLLVLDTTRADHFGLLGYPRDTTPFIDRLASEGMVWSHFTSAGTHTIPATSSILTGVGSASHRTTRVTAALGHSLSTLPELLRRYGYHTRLVTSNDVLVKPARQIGDRFDEADWIARPDENLFDDLVDSLREIGSQPFFIHAQPLACHSPYLAPEPFNTLFVNDAFYGGLGDIPRVLPDPFCYGGTHKSAVIGDSLSLDWYVSQYDGLLAYMDLQIERLFAVLEEQGLRENTLVVITADHGEMLGEHDYYMCHRTEYEPNTHVPLLIFLPRQYEREFGSRAGSWDDGNANQVDLAPTILAVLGIEPSDHFEGRDLLQSPGSDACFGHDLETRTIWSEQLKLIHRGLYPLPVPAVQLFDLSVDPNERDNLAAARPELVRALQIPLLSDMVSHRYRQRRPAPSGVFYYQDFSTSEPISDWANQQTCEGDGCAWSVADTPGRHSNRVLLGHAALPPHLEDGVHPIALLGFISEAEEPYSLALLLWLDEGEVEIATSASYVTDGDAVSVAWGYAVRISEHEVQLLRSRPEGGVVLLDRATLEFRPRIWHSVALTNDGAILRLWIDDELLLSGSSGRAPAYYHGTTYLGLFNQTLALFDDLTQWRGEDSLPWTHR